MKKIAFCFITLALVVAQAASSVTLHLTSPMTAAGTMLKAGEYKLQIEGNSVTLKSDGKTFTIPATTEKSGGGKYKETMMESEGTTLKSIHVGGTDTTILFSTTTASAGGH